MKTPIHTAATVALLLFAGSAASEVAAPSKGAGPAEPLAPHNTAGIETASPALKRLIGSYTLVGEQADSAKTIKNSIDAATAQMSAFKKNVARKRLADVNKVVTRLEISSVQNSVTIGMNDFIVTIPVDGGTANVKTPSGEMAEASFQPNTAILVQDIIQTQGRRENAFRFNSEENLVMQVRETSPQLASALSYSLVFLRVGQ